MPKLILIFSCLAMTACGQKINVAPEVVDKARELCTPHDGIKSLLIGHNINIRGTLTNPLRVTCVNGVVVEAEVRTRQDNE